MNIGDRITATSDRAKFASDMFYSGVFAGYTKTGKVKVKGKRGVRCYNPCNVSTTTK